jgi:hypothetical protein
MAVHSFWSARQLLDYRPALFVFAHRALCAAAIRFLPADVMVRFGVAFCFTHRAFCARLIFWRAAADMVLFLPPATALVPVPFM